MSGTAGRCRKIFVPRLRCGRCGVTHALLPAFVLAWRLDAAEAIGMVITGVAGGACGVRPAAAGLGVPYTTARGWCRRFAARAPELGVAFGALTVELGGDAVRPPAEPGRFALAAIGAAFGAGCALPGWAGLGPWRVAAAGGGRRAGPRPPGAVRRGRRAAAGAARPARRADRLDLVSPARDRCGGAAGPRTAAPRRAGARGAGRRAESLREV